MAVQVHIYSMTHHIAAFQIFLNLTPIHNPIFPTGGGLSLAVGVSRSVVVAHVTSLVFIRCDCSRKASVVPAPIFRNSFPHSTSIVHWRQNECTESAMHCLIEQYLKQASPASQASLASSPKINFFESGACSFSIILPLLPPSFCLPMRHPDVLLEVWIQRRAAGFVPVVY